MLLQEAESTHCHPSPCWGAAQAPELEGLGSGAGGFVVLPVQRALVVPEKSGDWRQPHQWGHAGSAFRAPVSCCNDPSAGRHQS